MTTTSAVRRMVVLALGLAGCARDGRPPAERTSNDSVAAAERTMDHAGHGGHAAASAATDSGAFAAMQARGQQAMGVDQYTSSHRFEPLADGGRIVLQRDGADSAGEATIRAHLRDVAARFAAGDFDVPTFVHGRDVPGTRTMAEGRAAIRYTVHDLPRGGELRIATSDAAAVAAVHAFLAFQRSDHRAKH